MLPESDTTRRERESAAAFAPRGGDLARIRALRGTEAGFDRAMWRRMCERGWLDLALPEFCAVAQELGAGLVPEPLIEAAMAAALLPAAHRPPVLTGDRIVLPAWQDHPEALDYGGGVVPQRGLLRGRKLLVPMARGADAFLVTLAQGVAIVERDAPGLFIESSATPDGGHLATLVFTDAPAELLPGDAADALDRAILAASAYLLGLCERALATTRATLKAREQVPRPPVPGGLVQQRVNDMQVQVALTGGVIAAATAQPDRRIISRARLRATNAALVVTRIANELLAGPGYRADSDVALCFTKAMVLCPLYGSAMAHRSRCAPA